MRAILVTALLLATTLIAHSQTPVQPYPFAAHPKRSDALSNACHPTLPLKLMLRPT
jgi:hypothetical protein